jgi:GTP-binding protein EngB required for normal cell division
MDLLSPAAASVLARERALLGRLHALLAETDADEATLRRLADLTEGLDGLFLLLVVGEFNAGKSSVVNALFGETVMEEGPVPTTDKITVLRHGARAEAHRRGDYVTERHHPHPLLRHLALVDTPGTNSIIREHQALTEDFVPRADLVLFVTSYDRPLTESERVFLDFIHRGWGKSVVVVLNKADLAGGEADPEAALAQVVEHVREGFRRHFGFVPRVFPVAARLAFAAKRAHPHDPAADTRWAASGFAPFETFLTDTLTAGERLALKLTAPLDAAEGLAAGMFDRLDTRRAVLEKDEAGLAALRARFAEKEAALREAFGRAAAEVDRELLEMEKRGVRFLDDTIRIAGLGLLRDRDRFKEEFNRQVVRDAERRIEERTGEAVDTLLRHVYELWNETYAHLAAQRAAAQTAGGERDAFLYNRDEVFRDVMREAKRSIDQYDLHEEARRILENARATAALFAGTQVAALGLGALATVIVAATAFDVTGGFVAAGALALSGFVLLPRQKKKAIREFTTRVEALRADLGRALRAQLDEEVEEAMGRVHRLVEPLARHTADARTRLDAAAAESDAVRADLDALRQEVRRQFGEARSLAEIAPGAAT